MNNNKGFTLVELLAVIVILAILIIMALIGVTKILNDSKKNMFLAEVRQIYKEAKKTWIVDTASEAVEKIYVKSKKEECDNKLPISVRDELAYFIKLNSDGHVVEYYITDGIYGYKYVGENLKYADIKTIFLMAKLKEEDLFEIKCDRVVNTFIEENTPPPGADLLMRQYDPLEDGNFLRTKKKKTQIEKVTFTNSLEGHTVNNVDCFDAGSYGKRKILSWIEDKNSNGLYEVTIGSEEKIFPNNCQGQFAYMKNLKELNGLEHLNTYNCTDMSYMFYFDEKLESLDVSKLKTNNATKMNAMFNRLQKVTSLDVSNFNTSKVTNMYDMFYDCRGLKSLDLSNFDTSNVTDMKSMLSRLEKIQTLDLSNFDTSKVTDMRYMFYYDTNLKSVNLSSFNTSNVTHMDFMFYNTRLETLDVSNFDTSKVRNMECMFDSLYNIKTLDLSSFDTSNVVNFDNMFQANNNLEKIYVSDKFVLNPSSTSRRMFWGCKKLKGGNGTIWNESKIDGTYAHIDGGPSNPGYFTAK